MKARWMDPSTGRFISPDPAKDGLNWFVYAGNNPTTMVDPTGLASSSAIDDDTEDVMSDIESQVNHGISNDPGTMVSGTNSSGIGGTNSTQQQVHNNIMDRMKQWHENLKNQIALNHQAYLERLHQHRLDNGYYDKMRNYNNFLGGLKNKQDEYGIHDAGLLTAYLNYKGGLLDPRTFGNGEMVA